MTDKKTTVDLSGALLCINGESHVEEHAVESGTLVARTEYLRDVWGEPQGVLEQDIRIDVELWEPPEADGHELVRCPNDCTGEWPVPREYELANGGTGHRNHCAECGTELVPADDTNQAVRNALADLETAADRVESDFDAEAIRQSVDTLREELGVDK